MDEFDFIEDEGLRKKVEKITKGLKTKNAELLGEQKKLKGQISDISDKLEKFDGLDADEVREMVKESKKQRHKKMIDDDKVEEVVAERVAEAKKEFADQNGKLQTRVSELEAANEKLTSENTSLNLGGTIGDAAAISGVRSKAMGTVKNMALQAFQRDDDGNFVVKNEKGETVYGKDGENPLTPQEWVEGLRTDHDYLFEKAKGGGRKRPGEGGMPEWDKMTEEEKVAALEADPSLAEDLPQHA